MGYRGQGDRGGNIALLSLSSFCCCWAPHIFLKIPFCPYPGHEAGQRRRQARRRSVAGSLDGPIRPLPFRSRCLAGHLPGQTPGRCCCAKARLAAGSQAPLRCTGAGSGASAPPARRAGCGRHSAPESARIGVDCTKGINYLGIAPCRPGRPSSRSRWRTPRRRIPNIDRRGHPTTGPEGVYVPSLPRRSTGKNAACFKAIEGPGWMDIF